MFPLFATRCLHVHHDVRDPSGGSGNCGRERCPVTLPKWRLPRHLGIFYMLQIYDMGLTALLPLWRKACWGFFSPLKIRRLWPGLNPRTWVLKASTLSLDHRSMPKKAYINQQSTVQFAPAPSDNISPHTTKLLPWNISNFSLKKYLNYWGGDCLIFSLFLSTHCHLTSSTMVTQRDEQNIMSVKNEGHLMAFFMQLIFTLDTLAHHTNTKT